MGKTDSRQIRAERLDSMENYILERNSVDFHQLSDYFGISLNTLRHDIAELCLRGNIKKVYGGVTSANGKTVTSVNERRYQNYGLKMKIGEVASTFVKDGSSIFVDAGSTAECMVSFLSNVKNVKITTHCLGVVEKASAFANLSLSCLGGSFSFSTRSFMDHEGIDVIRKSKYDYLFLGTSSIMPEGLFVDLYFVSKMKDALVDSSTKVILLSDSSKFMRQSPFWVCGFDRIDAIVTDKYPPEKIMAELERNNVDIIIA